MTTTRTLTAIAILACSHPALAQHAGDIFLDIQTNQIRTSLIDENSGEITENVRVFAAEFGEIFPDFTDEPGFDSAPGTFLPTSAIGFTIRRALRLWDNDDFDTLVPERIAIAFATLGPVLTPLDDTPVTGFTLPVGANGEWHRHYEYTIVNPSGPTADGVYLLELTLSSTDPALAPSLPFWIVFNQNDAEENHDAALEWVEANLIGGGCAGDWDGSSVITSDDYFAFLTDFFGEGGADFNTDGVTTSDDYFAFLAAFFEGCD